jgi:hypothetical protein
VAPYRKRFRFCRRDIFSSTLLPNLLYRDLMVLYCKRLSLPGLDVGKLPAHTHSYKTLLKPKCKPSSYQLCSLSTTPSIPPPAFISSIYLLDHLLFVLFVVLFSYFQPPPLPLLISDNTPSLFFNMLAKLWVVSALCAVALSAPTLTYSQGAASPAEMKVLSDYFQMLASKVQAGRGMAEAPVCGLSNAVLPVACKS